MHNHPIGVYYWNKYANFGDRLTSLLLKRFTGLDSEWSQPHGADLVMVGSIMHHLPKHFKGVIAGIGKLHETTSNIFPEAKTIGLRGYLSAKGIKGNIAIGDPALLADELVPLVDKEYDLGIVPHWSDDQLAQTPVFQQFKPLIIDVTDDPLWVITQICRCHKIVTSSLHGAILADAFGIPRRIELAPRMKTHPHEEGGVFKWRDYLSSIGEELELGKTKQADYDKIIDKQHELYDLFTEIGSIFKKAV